MVVFFITASGFWFGSGVAVVEPVEAGGKGRTQSADDAEILDEVDQNWKRTERIIGLSVFGVFFIVGMYWWTYGKLHHKLPRY